jgi:hypothetical protein
MTNYTVPDNAYEERDNIQDKIHNKTITKSH